MKDWARLLRAVAVAANKPPEGPWFPAADVFRTSGGWIVKFELAGVRSSDLALRIEGRSLALSGTRRDWNAHEAGTYQSMEISYSRFQRRIEFPCELVGAEIRTDYRDGMLLVHISCDDDGEEAER